MMQRLRESLVRIRNSAKKLRTVFEVSRKLRAKVSRGAGLHKHDFSRIAVTQGASAGDHLFGQLQNILNYTKVSGSAYSAQNFGAGYHTFMINGRRLAGQRDPAKRLELVPVDFSGKTVLDLGCNQGGMIHELKDAVKWAVGVDYDARMINAANKIKVALSSDNCSFFVLDLQNEPLDLILDFLSADRVDICFLLSICMWLNNWREVIDFAQRISNEMVFETNGTAQQQEQQIQHLRERYHDVHVLAETSGDDPVQKNRKLLHLTRPISRPIAPVA
jgi:SAM-dependent methyltransferase